MKRTREEWWMDGENKGGVVEGTREEGWEFVQQTCLHHLYHDAWVIELMRSPPANPRMCTCVLFGPIGGSPLVCLPLTPGEPPAHIAKALFASGPDAAAVRLEHFFSAPVQEGVSLTDSHATSSEKPPETLVSGGGAGRPAQRSTAA